MPGVPRERVDLRDALPSLHDRHCSVQGATRRRDRRRESGSGSGPSERTAPDAGESADNDAADSDLPRV